MNFRNILYWQGKDIVQLHINPNHGKDCKKIKSEADDLKSKA